MLEWISFITCCTRGREKQLLNISTKIGSKTSLKHSDKCQKTTLSCSYLLHIFHVKPWTWLYCQPTLIRLNISDKRKTENRHNLRIYDIMWSLSKHFWVCTILISTEELYMNYSQTIFINVNFKNTNIFHIVALQLHWQNLAITSMYH